MNKKYKLLLILLLLLLICVGCSNDKPSSDAGSGGQSSSVKSSESAGRNALLDKIFNEDLTPRLVVKELPDVGVKDNGVMIGSSPDGKTTLWRTENSDNEKVLTVVRDGHLIPVTANSGIGVGDPYDHIKYTIKDIAEFPSQQGLSWSRDGRYIVLSELERVSARFVPYDIPVIDTSDGALYLADTYNSDVNQIKEFGRVYISKTDREGKYVYYIKSGDNFQFCRCLIGGKAWEVLYDATEEADCHFDMTGTSNLFEEADGSWLFLGTDTYRYENSSKSRNLSLTHFYLSGDTWKAESIPLDLPYDTWHYASSSYSSESGYGLVVLTKEMLNSADNADLNSPSEWETQVARYIQVIRIRPDHDKPYDIWYMPHSQDDSPSELLSAEPFLLAWKLKNDLIDKRERQALLNQEVINDLYQFITGGSSSVTSRDLMLNRQTVTCASISPDGHYAVINSGFSRRDNALYLVNLETMKCKRISSPDGAVSTYLGSTALGKEYKPGVTWNEDGTLLILGEDNKTRTLQLIGE